MARLPPYCSFTVVATELLENGCFAAPAFVEVFAFLCREDLQVIDSLGTKHQPVQIPEGLHHLQWRKKFSVPTATILLAHGLDAAPPGGLEGGPFGLFFLSLKFI